MCSGLLFLLAKKSAGRGFSFPVSLKHTIFRTIRQRGMEEKRNISVVQYNLRRMTQ